MKVAVVGAGIAGASSAFYLAQRGVEVQYFVVPNDFAFTDGAVGCRPTFSDGLPRRGFAENVEGLYFVVAHPGVILGPLVSRLAAEEIVSCCG